MQLAGPAVIVKPVRHIGVLLKLEERDSAADRMDRAWRDIEKIACPDGPPFNGFDDRAVKRGEAELLLGEGTPKPKTDCRPLGGAEYIPALRLSSRSAAQASLRVIRMDLNRERLTREQIFCE
jgi:hypothetical protein